MSVSNNSPVVLHPNDAKPDTSACRSRRFAKVITVASLRLISVLVGLVYVKYYTNALSIEEVGAFFYLGTLSYLLNALVFVPVDSYMQSRLSDFDKIPWRVLSRLVCVALLIGLGACVVLSTPFFIMGKLSLLDIPLLYGLAALLYLCSSLRNLLNIRGHATLSVVMILLESLARLFVFVFVASIFGASAQALLFSSILAFVAEYLILLWQARRLLPLSSSNEELDSAAKIVRTVAVLSGGAVANTVQLQSYRIFFSAFGYAGTVAALGVTANIGAVAMSSCSQVFSQLFLPRLYQSRGASIGQYAGWGVALGAALLAVGLPVSEFLVRKLSHAEYAPYALAVGFGIVIEGCNMLIGAYGVYLTLHQRLGVLFRFQLAGAVLSVLGCAAMLAKAPGDPIGVGTVVAASQLLVTSALAYYVHVFLRQND